MCCMPVYHRQHHRIPLSFSLFKIQSFPLSFSLFPSFSFFLSLCHHLLPLSSIQSNPIRFHPPKLTKPKSSIFLLYYSGGIILRCSLLRMEKDGLFGNFNWQPDHHSISAAVAAVAEMNNNNNNNIGNNSGSCDNGNGNGNGADQSSVLAATSSFLNLNWDQSSADQTANFESALSSLVSSPSSSNPNPNLPAASADSLVIRELIGRLGSICNNNSSSEASPPNSSHYQSTNNSCYSTPLNSPPKLNLLSMMDRHPQFQLARAAAAGGGNMGNNNNNSHRPVPFAADPGFAERAARFSCFGAATATVTARNYAQFGLPEPGKLSRVSSSQSLKGMTMPNNGVGVNVNHPNPMHLQQQLPQQLDGMGSGIGGQLENDMLMTMTMMRSSREFGSNNTQDESSASGRMAPNVNMNVNEGNVRKRKATTPSSNKGNSSGGGGRGKEATPDATPNPIPNPNPPKRGEEENSNSKRSKSAAAEAAANADGTGKDHAVKTPKAEQNSTSSESAQKQGKDKDKDNNVNPPELPKQDYIHVRARRGQATDSHSLAERVRRERISERMKFLQDLVPGCNKVTGKAVMLDEIINYVQSLQRQVEFLSMKLATVNPRLDINVDSLLTKDVHQPRGPMMAPQSSYPLEATSNGFSYANQPQGQNPLQSLIASNGLQTQCSVNNLLDASSLLRRSLGMQLPSLEGFTDAAASQLGAFWEDDLQSVVQMGFGQDQEAMFSSHNFQGPSPTSHTKIEL